MNSLLPSIKRAFSQPAFVATVAALAICAATLNGAVAMLKLRFQKQSVPLRISLKEGLPQTLNHWVCVSKDTAINPEIEQVLGTPLYVFRDYVDARKFTSAEVRELKDAPESQKEVMLANFQSIKPSAIIRVGVTYYTGSADTVAHVPERCYVADGFQVKGEPETISAALGNYPDGKPRDVAFRFLTFEDQVAVGSQVPRVSRSVGYLFHCDGAYESDPYEVRVRLQNLRERYGYYAKVELMVAGNVNGNNPNRPVLEIIEPGKESRSTAEQREQKQEIVRAMTDFFNEALPEVEKCLPDWQSVHSQK